MYENGNIDLYIINIYYIFKICIYSVNSFTQCFLAQGVVNTYVNIHEKIQMKLFLLTYVIVLACDLQGRREGKSCSKLGTKKE